VEIIYLKRALEDLSYWKKTGNKKYNKELLP